MRKTAVVFYASTRGDWEKRTRRALDRMVSSGLYEGTDEIYLVVSDIQDTNQETIGLIGADYPKCMVERHLTQTASEHNGIARVEEIGNRVDGEYNILYMHSKGVMNQYKTVLTENEPYPIKVNGVKTWIDMMEYFLVDHWVSCVSKLEEDRDTVGVKNHSGWWWGNFWWSTSEHIKRLRKPYVTGSRWDCEGWLHDWHPNKNDIKYFEWFKFQYNPYYTDLPRYLWDLSDKTDVTVTIRRVEYGDFGEQQDEGRPIPTEEKSVDVTELALTDFDGRTLNIWNIVNQHREISPATASVRVWYHTSIEPTVERVATSIGTFFGNITLVRED